MINTRILMYIKFKKKKADISSNPRCYYLQCWETILQGSLTFLQGFWQIFFQIIFSKMFVSPCGADLVPDQDNKDIASLWGKAGQRPAFPMFGVPLLGCKPIVWAAPTGAPPWHSSGFEDKGSMKLMMLVSLSKVLCLTQEPSDYHTFLTRKVVSLVLSTS